MLCVGVDSRIKPREHHPPYDHNQSDTQMTVKLHPQPINQPQVSMVQVFLPPHTIEHFHSPSSFICIHQSNLAPSGLYHPHQASPPTPLVLSTALPENSIPEKPQLESLLTQAFLRNLQNPTRSTAMGFPLDTSKTTKLERYNSDLRRVNSTKLLTPTSKLLFRATLLTAVVLILFFTLNHPSLSTTSTRHPRSLLSSSSSSFASAAGGAAWEWQVRQSATPPSPTGISVLVTGAAGFVGSHCSLALKKRGDGVLGLDNFNSYYDPSLKRARQSLLLKHGVFIVDADINDGPLLKKIFEVVPFTHVLHLAAQAGVRYAMKNPQSYVHSNIAGFVNLLEVAAKQADPQPAIVWASSSSVYGLNTVNPFSESDRTDRPASLYAATKKADEEIAHTYNHIYGLSLTGLRFFTVYGPWGRPDMAYFSFTKDILNGKPITVFQAAEGEREVARDFTFINDVVGGCLGALDTAEKSTGIPGGGKKRGPAQLRVYNLGNTSPVPVSKLVAILEGLLGTKAKKQIMRMPGNGDVPYTHANVSLAHRDFGYKPTTDLATGLRKFVKWYVGYYGIESKGRSASPADGVALSA